ncbi:TDP-N-acetylfucosamine:lipid II N-acetylfucosaminyltransferase [Aliarcobacter butzleri]|uniref:TDP-N-acetylfucosamine:lipid II N-acetylfucosaminyltransferase n=1 Tax=Aliarcobacter butzleri TaxID=28197 RepID=A0AAW7QF35_9BACT|nr:TDP-N-acetylfucosamine:lipid II N-acetylfucosaminyltransferase [Aliarcobacter butzleri]MDN5107361.1 TDP-N-acetylfucosamine:lipid II N-acetylfucosaminyltransferase [Aliarcobacter butzleri]MDN5124370.1 TDP-N-acetylfucosamine:lipid II N-acetylfucosaminyltransferase [Aliarcobacter butzleri]
MNQDKILHVMILDKFLAPFINFVDEHFGRENHYYVFITSEKYEYGLTLEHKVEFLHTDDDIFIILLEYMKIAKKIILHGLWRDKVDVLLYFNLELLKKCYWVIWGGDFYFPETKSKIRHKIIKNIAYLVTYIKDDYELTKKWYGISGKYYECFMYPSNIYKEYDIKPKESNTINIQLGNSADPSNNHIQVLQQLVKYKDKDIKLYVPLSYGKQEYAKEVISKGKELFADKFIPITEFMLFEKYLEFMSKIDIAIFAHKRQQAIGNIISLLGLGKKVYLDTQTVQFNFLRNHDISVFNIEEIDLIGLSEEILYKNKEKIKYLFSKESLKKDLQRIFND